jgi:hypothetical protein
MTFSALAVQAAIPALSALPVLAVPLPALAVQGAGAAAVPTGDRPVTADLDGPARLRSGIVIGTSLGVGLGAASGYPNDSTKIGDLRYYSASGAMIGASESVMLMGALADTFSFGFWFDHAGYSNGDFRSNGYAGGLRIEAFPLVRLYPSSALVGRALDGLAAFGEFGIGQANLVSNTPRVPSAEGTQSFVSGGAFYEWPIWRVLGGHFAVGPSLQYDAMWSTAISRQGLVASLRLVFYGGP